MCCTRRIAIFVLSVTIGVLLSAPSASKDLYTISLSDSAYSAHHPRLLFSRDNIPDLITKISDGGRDTEAFAYACSLVQYVYPGYDNAQLLSHSYGVGTFPLLYVMAWLESPQDTIAINTGRRLVEHTVANYDPDYDVYYSPLRLRGLALGYDAFYQDAGDSIRSVIRGEMEAYIDTMLTTRNYEYWKYSPFLSNITTMIAASLGLAAICLDGETSPDRVDAALLMADDYIDIWLEKQLDPDGAYKEGGMYAGWCMRNLVFYFEARKRYDGYDYATVERIRNIERWVAYTLLPLGPAQINNINDAATLNHPYSRHHAYFDWAQTAWGSGLSSWLWERLRGPELGFDSGELADPAATMLWHRDVPPTPPEDLLPNRFLWEDRGMYYFRSGWPADSTGQDVVLSFYSGKFYGGHSQEDQNNFTLYGYGRRFVIDHGYGAPGRDSEAHNMVFIDGLGQHHSGGSTGTDGKISEFLMSGFADYLLGDATAAYNTYSEFNRNGYPFPENDWSPGHIGSNPVEYAHRKLLVVHGPETPPYFVLMDEIDKDGTMHTYQWRIHTDDTNAIHLDPDSIRIGDANGWMDLRVLSPDLESYAVQVEPYDNGHEDPDANVLRLFKNDVIGRYTVLMLLGDSQTARPSYSKADSSWGTAFRLEWPGGIIDHFLQNHSGQTVNHAGISTDASFCLIRASGSEITRYLLADATALEIGEIPYVRVDGKPVTLALDGDQIAINREKVSFRLYAPSTSQVTYRDDPLPVRRDGAYLVSLDGIASPDQRVAIEAFPNPSNSTVNIIIDIVAPGDTEVAIYDVAGRLVRTIWSGDLPAGPKSFVWDGLDDRDQPVSSGVYLVRARSSGFNSVKKLVLLH